MTVDWITGVQRSDSGLGLMAVVNLKKMMEAN